MRRIIFGGVFCSLRETYGPFEQWNYHESIQNGDMGVTTNPLENINLKLKSKMGHGYLTQKSAFKKLKIFEEDEICFYTSPGQRGQAPDIPKISRFIPKIPSSCLTNV